MKDYKSKAIEGDKAVPANFTVEDAGDATVIKTKSLTLYIHDGFYMEAYDANGHLLMEDYRGQRVKKVALDQKAADLLEAEGHDASKSEGGDYAVQTLKVLAPEDSFYGLGDKSGFLNKRHYEYENWNSDLPQAHTEDFHALYKSIPFLICLRKDCVYGLFFDNTFHSYLNLGKESEEYFCYGADDGNLDYYILGGETMAEVIKIIHTLPEEHRCHSFGHWAIISPAGATHPQRISWKLQRNIANCRFRAMSFIWILTTWTISKCLHGTKNIMIKKACFVTKWNSLVSSR